MSKADEAREELRLLVLEFQRQAADHHAEGMTLCRRAARIEQLIDICNDDSVVEFRDRLLLAQAEDTPAVDFTQPGGDA